MPRPSKDDATFEGPLRLLVAGGFAYLLWLLVTKSREQEAALPASVQNATLLNTPS